MERRFRVRLGEILDDAKVRPGLLRGLATRLDEFVRPFAESLGSDPRRRHATRYVQGLLSNLGAKNVEAIAYLHDRERQGLQKFIGQADWDHEPVMGELALQVGAELGEPDGVLVFDPSAFPKKGAESVGVQRQWCGRLGKLENCQSGSTSPTSAATSTRWSMSGCTCPRSGPGPASGWRPPGCHGGRGSGPATS